jgi:hypothetical protein
MVSLRLTLIAITWLAAASHTAALAADVRCEVKLKHAATQFRSGEPIELRLAFIADAPGYLVNRTTTKVVVEPTQGLYAWRKDRARFRHPSDVVLGYGVLEAGKPFLWSITLNDDYRFDSPGHYTVHIDSQRVTADPNGVAPRDADAHSAALDCNAVVFDVIPFPSLQESARVVALQERLRASTDIRETGQLVSDLIYLPGDDATAAKLSLFLHPLANAPWQVDSGLWIARNRAVVVAGLERAIVDPEQTMDISMGLLGTLVNLEASLETPYDPRNATASPRLEEIRARYVHQIALTIPMRRGEPGITAALAVFMSTADHVNNPVGPDFEVSREYVVTHFSDVNLMSVDWLLHGYGKYLIDPRLVSALQHVADVSQDPQWASAREEALKQLALIRNGGA